MIIQSTIRLSVRIIATRDQENPEMGSGVLLRTTDDRLMVMTALHCLGCTTDVETIKQNLENLSLTIDFFNDAAEVIQTLDISSIDVSVPREVPGADIAIVHLPANHGLNLELIKPARLCFYWEEGKQYRLFGFPSFLSYEKHKDMVFQMLAIQHDNPAPNIRVLSCQSPLSDQSGESATETYGGISGGGVFIENTFDLVGVIREFFDEYARQDQILIQPFEPKIANWLSTFGLVVKKEKTSSLDPLWFQKQFETAKQQLDTRYTPQYHVSTETEKILDAFFLRDSFVNKFWENLRQINAKTKVITKIIADVAVFELNELNMALKPLQSKLDNIAVLPGFDVIQTILTELIQALKGVFDRLEEAQQANLGKQTNDYAMPFSYELRRISNLSRYIGEQLSFLVKFEAYDKQFLLVEGCAGSGKSHLLASTVEKALKSKQPALLFVGEQFIGRNSPLDQLASFVSKGEIDSLLTELNHAGEGMRPTVLAIDALNESDHRKIWKNQLLQMVSKIVEYPNIRLLVSCRTDFLNYTLPPAVQKKHKDWTYVEQLGFEQEVFNAVTTYFAGYKVISDHFPLALDEFKNPLFLKIFCEAFKNERVPVGPVSFDTVLKKRIQKARNFIEKKIDCPGYKIDKALGMIADAIWQNEGQSVPHAVIRPKIDEIFDGDGQTNSLYMHLRSNDLITETLRFDSSDSVEPLLYVRFPYERFSEYMTASKILESYNSIDELRSDWKKKGLPEKWCQDFGTFYDNRGLLQMMAILVPERFRVEFIELIDESSEWDMLEKDLLESLCWRSINSINPGKIRDNLRSMRNEEILNGLIKLVAIPEHPFNAKHLHKVLKDIELWQREKLWTLPCGQLFSDGDSIRDALWWSFRVSLEHISLEQARLMAIFLSWLLSTNNRLLRSEASLALTRIITKDLLIADELIREFHDCNDPYIVERVYAAVCGASLRCNDANKLWPLARKIYERMFASNNVPPHILQRDYARLTLEYINYYFGLPSEIDCERYKPPYRSKYPRIIAEKDAKRIEDQDGWWTIKSSLQPEESGFYGDFGRYIMDANLHYFSDATFKQPPRKNRWRRFRGMRARRYILQRIEELGWTSERFGDVERHLSTGRLHHQEEAQKTERISKKYQWIGLHELLGYISDRYRTKSYDKPEPFEGAWQLFVRDFDPTQPFHDQGEYFDNDDSFDSDQHSANIRWITYPDPFFDKRLRFDRQAWVETQPACFSSLIEFGHEWVNLFGHYLWNEPLFGSQDEETDGRLEMWSSLRCWLVKNEDVPKLLQQAEGTQFWGEGCDIPQFHNAGVGEYPWSPALRDVIDFCGQTDRWLGRTMIDMHMGVCEYLNENVGISAPLPGPMVCKLLGLKWSGNAYEYENQDSEIIAYYPASLGGTRGDPSPLLVQKKIFLNTLEKAGYKPLWAVLSERSCFSSLGGHKSIVMKTGVNQRVYGYESGVLKRLHDKSYTLERYN